MNKLVIISRIILPAAALFTSQSVMALSDGDGLIFDDRSYFGMEISPGWYLNTTIEAHNGIVIGKEQPAEGSHSGWINGTEKPSIDKPWNFFGNIGMHQTILGSGGITIINDDGAGNYELDFSGFGVTWNGIPNIAMDGPSGVATLSCSTAACKIGDAFVLDYDAAVPIGDPSGFGGVRYRLHLEGTVNLPPVDLNLRVSVDGGLAQECSEYGGSTVHMTATYDIPAGQELASVSWNANGISEGDDLTQYFALGDHSILVTVATTTGEVDSEIVNLSVKDTTDPVITADFISYSSGMVIDQVDKERKVVLDVSAADICDPAPVITHSSLKKNDSINATDGMVFMTTPNGSTDLHALQESLSLTVNARDASGNIGYKNEILTVK